MRLTNSRLASYPGHVKKKKSGLVSIVCACAKIYGIESVNVSVNGLSHMPRSSTETVYGTLSERTKKTDFLQLKWQSNVVKQPVIIYLLRLL